MKSAKMLLGILVGATLGAVAGVLFAPDKGSRTRKLIRNKGDDYADDLKEKIGDLADSISKKYKDALHEVDDMILSGKSKFNSALEEADTLISNGKNKLNGDSAK
jgi:gas vesicle protein